MKNTIEVLKPLDADFGSLNDAFRQRAYFHPSLRNKCDEIGAEIRKIREDIPCGDLSH